jgi:drug/metabolite transporter (DMT)-like permease
VLWALNITVTRYMLTHGFLPLAYGTTRYGAAALIALVVVWALERSFRIGGRDLLVVIAAAVVLWANQMSFVVSVHLTTASTVALIFGATPVFAGIFATLAGLGRQTRTFWASAAVSFAGVALIAGAGVGVSADLLGDLLALSCAATWAVYSVLVAPLMERHSPYRISALVLALGWLPLAATGASQVARQPWSLPGVIWLLFGYAVIGPLFLTNILWYRAIGKVGPARAALFGNLEPFLAVLLAVLLLSEHLDAAEIAGGVLVFGGILLERRAHAPPFADSGLGAGAGEHGLDDPRVARAAAEVSGEGEADVLGRRLRDFGEERRR